MNTCRSFCLGFGANELVVVVVVVVMVVVMVVVVVVVVVNVVLLVLMAMVMAVVVVLLLSFWLWCCCRYCHCRSYVASFLLFLLRLGDAVPLVFASCCFFMVDADVVHFGAVLCWCWGWFVLVDVVSRWC